MGKEALKGIYTESLTLPGAACILMVSRGMDDGGEMPCGPARVFFIPHDQLYAVTLRPAFRHTSPC